MNTLIKKTHFAFYGTKRLLRGYCKRCDRNAIIIDARLQCCNAKVDESVVPKSAHRMSATAKGRRLPSKSAQGKTLLEQNNSCFYCERRFGSLVWRHGKPMRLRIHWDHMVPYSYSQDNAATNFVAACHVCNGIKSNFIFKTVDEARVHINERRQQKGYSDEMPEMRIEVPRETRLAEVLQP